jgi:hypothetical protein
VTVWLSHENAAISRVAPHANNQKTQKLVATPPTPWQHRVAEADEAQSRAHSLPRQIPFK